MTTTPSAATPSQAARPPRLQVFCKYLCLLIFAATVLGVAAVAQDGGQAAAAHPGAVVVTADNITSFGDLSMKGVLGWQVLTMAQRALDAFGRLVTAAERVASEGVKVEDVRVHAGAVGDLADAVRTAAHRNTPTA